MPSRDVGNGKKPCSNKIIHFKGSGTNKQTENGCGRLRMVHTDLELGLWGEQIYSTLCLQHPIAITSLRKPVMKADYLTACH